MARPSSGRRLAAEAGRTVGLGRAQFPGCDHRREMVLETGLAELEALGVGGPIGQQAQRDPAGGSLSQLASLARPEYSHGEVLGRPAIGLGQGGAHTVDLVLTRATPDLHGRLGEADHA